MPPPNLAEGPITPLRQAQQAASDPPLHLGSAGSSLISNDSPGAARPHRAWRMHSRKMAPSRCYDVTESGQADQGRSSAQSSGRGGAQLNKLCAARQDSGDVDVESGADDLF